MATIIRDVQDNDLDRILAINNAAVPNVNELTFEDLGWFQNNAAYFRVSETDDIVSGFLIALRPELDYGSQNFTWFKANYDNFVYIDRVVVARDNRGLGIGRLFYADVQSYAEQIAPLLTCEVNLVPRNDVSLLFHGTIGFHEVGRQDTHGGEKHVSLLAKELPAYEYVRQAYGSGQ
jgi:predicted GNAT superfamily acetyltransferase